MKEIDMNQFILDLASDKPAPGGGAASALAGVLGTALGSMVICLTMGREKYKDSEPLMRELLGEAKELQCALNSLIKEDAEAYNKVAAVFKMPKGTEEEKAARREAMQEALKHATVVPYRIMKKTVKALEIHQRSLGHTNPNAISDTGVGVLFLKTALLGAHLNVKINLGIISDEDFVNEYETKSTELLKDGSTIADEIYDYVLKQL